MSRIFFIVAIGGHISNSPARVCMAARIGVKRIRAIAASVARREIKDETEHKVQDYVVFGNISANPTCDGVSLLAQGSDFFNRTGSQVQGVSLFLRWTVRWLVTAANPAQIFRIVVFMDTGCEGAFPSTVNTANSLVTGAAATASTEAQLNPLTRKRFLVLYNKVGWVTQTQPARTMVKNIKLRSPTIQYIGTTNGIASAGTNNIFISYWGDVVANMATFSYQMRFRYIDA